MPYTDAEILQLVGDEKKRSVGFEINAELRDDRERALNYLKGDMTDVPALPNRSTAVSTDVADTIETWLADMVEVLAGGEDVVTFQPNGEQDEAQARQETDYVNHVFFNENDGFMVLYTMLKDAGEAKTGVVTWWDEDVPAPEPKNYGGLTMAEIGLIEQEDASAYQITDIQPSTQMGLEPLFDVTLEAKPRKRARVAAVNPQDFTVAADTVKLKDATYCAMRSRPRAQDLIADGIDADTVRALPPYTSLSDTETQARDTAGEHENGASNGGLGDLRQVEIVKHYIRLVEDDGEMKIWCVRTGNDDRAFIDRYECDEIPFAAITPYPVTHRFYGLSVADKTLEPQKVKTTLTRIALDSAYFALNQRVEVSEEAASDNTIPDLMRNEPMMPVRSKTGNALKPLQAGALNFDPFNALEYFATVIEARTGVVRNAQGLNPDTLHDTAGGAAMLASAAQKRSRLMARIFAETGIRDLYLGLHALLRRIGGMTDTVRLGGQWVPVDPTQWGQRQDMTVEVGVGSSGRAQDLAAMNLVTAKQAEVVQMQGGANGPLVTQQNLYASAIRITQKAGLKNPEAFWTDPSQAQPQAPQPDPKVIAAQTDAANDQARVQVEQGQLALDTEKAHADAGERMAKLQLEARRIALDEQKLQLEAIERDRAHQINMAKIEALNQQAQAKLDTDAALRLAEMNAKYQTSIDVAQIKSNAEQFRAGADVLMQAAGHVQEHVLADREHAHGLTEMAADHVLGSLAEPEAEPDADDTPDGEDE